MNVMAETLRSDAVRIAVAAFCEGRDLKGQWGLRITGAELVFVGEDNT